MWNPFTSSSPASKTTQKVIFKIDGMHCVSCGLNIDGELEDTTGVISASTNYARQVTEVEFDSSKVDTNTLKKTIQKLGYSVVE